MTAKQRQFEEYVNEQQARQDELSDLKEWRRLKDLEEEAIALYHDLDENLEEYTAQMRTRDQMEMELQCGRNKQIEKDLSVNTQRAVAAARSIPFAMEQERIKATKAKVQADFKAGVEASMANTKISINATGSQQASKQSEVTQSKPKKHRKTSQSVSSTEAGSPKQQQEKTKPSSEEICDQLQDQAPNKSQSPSATIDQLTSSGTPVGTSSSKQQEEKKQPSAEEIRCQFAEQVQKRLAEAGLLRSAAPLRHQERKNELSPEGVCNKPQAPLQAQPAALTRMPPITKTVRPVPSQSAASAPLRHLGNGVIFGPNCWTGPSTGYQQQTRLNYGVHYSEGSVLVRKETGLTKAFLGCSSQAEQSLAHNIHQSPDTPPEHRVITSTERSPERISPHQSSNSTSSNKSSDSASPDKSSDSTSPDQSPDSTSLEKSPDSASPYQAPDARYTPPPSAGPSAPRTQTVQTMPIVNSFNTLGIWARNGDQSGPSPPRTSVQPIVPVVSSINTHEMWSRNLTTMTSTTHQTTADVFPGSSGYHTVVHYRVYNYKGSKVDPPFGTTRRTTYFAGRRCERNLHASRDSMNGKNGEGASAIRVARRSRKERSKS